MARTYVFDSTMEEHARRNWSSLVPSPEPVTLLAGQFVREGSEGNLREGVVLVHRRSIPDVVNALKAACENNALVVVVVSGGVSTEREVIGNRLYFRRWPVDNPIDKSFAGAWTKFVGAHASGLVDFSLLEPKYTPTLWSLKILVESYLLASPAARHRVDGLEMARAQKTSAETGESTGHWIASCVGFSDVEELRAWIAGELTPATASLLASLLVDKSIDGEALAESLKIELETFVS